MAIRLVPFTERHLSAFEGMLDDPDIQRFTRLPVPAPPGFPRTWLSRYEQGRRDGTSDVFAIEDEAGEFLGCVMAFGIEAAEQTCELGYLVAPAARGRGVGTAALRALTEWAFGERGLLRLELMISVDNEASKVVAERAGYVKEGVLRSVYVSRACARTTSCGRACRATSGAPELSVRVGRRVAVVQHERVAVGILEDRLVADAAVDDVALELHAPALQLRSGGRHVADAQRDRSLAGGELAPDPGHVEQHDRQVPRLDLAADAVAVALRDRQSEDARVERLRLLEVGDGEEDEVGVGDECRLVGHQKPSSLRDVAAVACPGVSSVEAVCMFCDLDALRDNADVATGCS
ncbi:MAG TPA: GNAT family N-acetyltransferase [Gaiellales bacterium]